MNHGYVRSEEFDKLSQKIAEAIEAVTKIDVTIMDANRKRIAATGKYQEPAFGNVAEKSAFSICLNSGEICIIERAREDDICLGCPCLETCIEEAEICVPIIWQQKPIGVIGLIAFDTEQKKIILDNCNAYINFVQKMASLLEAKYGEIMALEENRRLTQKMRNIINNAKREKYLVLLDDEDELKQELIKTSEQKCSITFSNILSVSKIMDEIKEMAKTVATIESPVLIHGESGTGKELFARAIHHYGNRSEKPFIPINCGAIPDELLESELFGYEKGAFTGAFTSKKGKFEMADRGTIFLDEIAELPLKLQVKLLRVLQEKEICRLGSNEFKKIDVRILSATNANLEERIQNNLFRKDLYYRLNIFPIHIPPLRSRKEDIEYLVNHFINYYNNQFEKNIKGLSEEVRELFFAYSWPGNVRELQSVIEFGVFLETKERLSEPLIGRRLHIEADKKEIKREKNVDSFGGDKQIFLESIKKYEALTRKKMTENVCDDLGISRSTFYRKLKKYT